ncbi:MAG: DNA polymerase III subunit delta' [Bacteroidia bacterium]|nr:DNA polymerase III subunit delta' [Bacteroidia bacterium]
MLFKEVIGQYAIKERLVQTVKEGRISHAQLFIGPKGTGKLAMALAYAQYISCENRQENDSCGVCPSCHKFNKLIHPDLHFVFPVVKKSDKKPVSDSYIETWREVLLQNPYISPNEWYEAIGAEKSQGLIYTDESEEIIRKLNFKTFEGEYKIMIIWLAEKMHPAAANKLLKILEEPPPNTIFFLLSEEPELMLPTILSRTQLIKLPKIDDNSLSETIKDRFDLSDEEIQNIVRISGGSFLNALNIIQSSDEQKFNFKKFQELMRLCYGQKIFELQGWVDSIATVGREKQKSFLGFSLRMIRENFLMHIAKPELIYLTKEESDFSEKFHPFINSANVRQIAEELNKAQYHIERNGNARIVLLDMTLKLVKFLKQKV